MAELLLGALPEARRGVDVLRIGRWAVEVRREHGRRIIHRIRKPKHIPRGVRLHFGMKELHGGPEPGRVVVVGVDILDRVVVREVLQGEAVPRRGVDRVLHFLDRGGVKILDIIVRKLLLRIKAPREMIVIPLRKIVEDHFSPRGSAQHRVVVVPRRVDHLVGSVGELERILSALFVRPRSRPFFVLFEELFDGFVLRVADFDRFDAFLVVLGH